MLHAVGQAALDGLEEAGLVAGEDVAGDGRVATPAGPAAVSCTAHTTYNSLVNRLDSIKFSVCIHFMIMIMI